MEFAKVKILRKKPAVRIDNGWFPYRDIINSEEFDDELCIVIGEAIEYNGRRRVAVYYDVVERDNLNRPTRIRVGCNIKGKPYDGDECVFNTIYHSDPLQCTYSIGVDPNVDPFIYKRFMEPETYIDDGDD